MQEVINNKGKKFLIIGIGINILSNPDLNDNYKATNILQETNKNPSINEIIEMIIISYEKFFNNIKSYDYVYYKKKANLMVLEK